MSTSAVDRPDNRKILAVFGDSLSAGNGLDAGQSFPDDLQRKLDAQGYPWRVVNLGIGGNTTEEGVARMDSATSLKPAIVLLELGGNDGLQGLPLTGTRQNLETMIRTFQDAGAKVVLAGMTLPPNYGSDYILGFQKIYKDLAAQYHLPFIPFSCWPISLRRICIIYSATAFTPPPTESLIVSETVPCEPSNPCCTK